MAERPARRRRTQGRGYVDRGPARRRQRARTGVRRRTEHHGRPKDFPAELRAIAGSLEHAAGSRLDPNRVAAEAIAALFEAWEAFAEDRWRREFKARWSRYDTLTGKSVRVGLRGEPLAGVVDGIDDEGSLILRTGGRRRQVVASGEVTLRKP